MNDYEAQSSEGDVAGLAAREGDGEIDGYGGPMHVCEDGNPECEIEVIVLNEAETRQWVEDGLALAGCTWEELYAQSKTGRFSSSTAREVWFTLARDAKPLFESDARSA